MNRRSAKRPRYSVDGQPVFENEDSSNHSGLGVTDYDDLLHLLIFKDKEGFFQYPVTDQVKSSRQRKNCFLKIFLYNFSLLL
jgi:hypothetical protein